MSLGEYYKRLFSVCLICMVATAIIACGQKQDTMSKIKDLEFTIISEENIPEELQKTIDEKKQAAFRLTFEDRGFLYICVGYGMQTTGGYSISVKELYETGNALYLDTDLIGPAPEEKSNPVASFPYVVVKTEFIDKPVVFE